MNVLTSRGVAMSAPVMRAYVGIILHTVKNRLDKAITEDVLRFVCKEGVCIYSPQGQCYVRK